MHRLQITVLDLVSKGGRRNLFGRVMNPNLASIMPQVVAAWCEASHHVHMSATPAPRTSRANWSTIRTC